MFELQEIMFAFLGAIVGAIGVITASRIKSEPSRMGAETDRIEAMWTRLDHLERANESLRLQIDDNKIEFGRRLDEERRDCDRRMDEMETHYNRKIEDMRQQISDLRRVQKEMSEPM